MADQKISQLTEETTPASADIFAIAVDLASTPVTKKITLANLITAINKPAGSSGHVQFNNAGAFGGDDDLFWDIANKRLGIGTTAPTKKLEIAGPIKSTGAGQSSFAGGLSVLGGSNFYDNIILSGPYFRFSDNVELQFGTGIDYSIGYNSTDDTLQFVDGGAVGTNVRMVLDNAGNLGIGTTTPTISDGIGLHLSGKILRIGTSKTPASAGAAGNAGELCWDAGYLYICTATNTWKRASVATW